MKSNCTDVKVVQELPIIWTITYFMDVYWTLKQVTSLNHTTFMFVVGTLLSLLTDLLKYGITTIDTS